MFYDSRLNRPKCIISLKPSAAQDSERKMAKSSPPSAGKEMRCFSSASFMHPTPTCGWWMLSGSERQEGFGHPAEEARASSAWPSAAANSWAWMSPFSPHGLQSQSGQLYLGGGGCLEGPIYRWARPGEEATQWGLLIALWDEWIALPGLFLPLTWQKLPSGEMPKIFSVTYLWLASIFFFFFLLAFRFMLRLTMLEDSFKCVQSSA